MRCHLSVLLAFLLLASSGCTGGQSPGSFNDTVAMLQFDLSEADRKLEKTTSSDDPEKRKSDVEVFRNAVARVRKSFDELKMPEGDAGKKFHAGFDEYLKAHEEAVRVYKDYLDPDHKLTPEEDKRNSQDLDKFRSKRDELSRRLVSLQQAYANEAGFTLKQR